MADYLLFSIFPPKADLPPTGGSALEKPMADYFQKPVANYVLLTELERGI